MVRAALLAGLLGTACTVSTADTSGPACPAYSGFAAEASWIWSTSAAVEEDYGYYASETGDLAWLNDDGSEVQLTILGDIDDDAFEYSFIDTVERWACDDDGARLVSRRVDTVSKPVDGEEVSWYSELTVESGGVYVPSSLVDGTVWTTTITGTLDADGQVEEASTTEEFLAQELDDFSTWFGDYPALRVQILADDGTQQDHAWWHTDMGRLADRWVSLEDYRVHEVGDTGDTGDTGL